MNTFAVLFLCIQVCLVQNAFSQCLGRIPGAVIAPAAFGPFGYSGVPDYGYLGAYPSAYASPYGLDSYGGTGEGNVAVAGELPVAGFAAVAGQVPIMGVVTFGGPVPAAGVVTITGSCTCCSCSCGAPYLY